MTSSFKKFATMLMLLIFSFRCFFSYFIEVGLYSFAYIPAIICGLGMVANSFIYLINDSEYLPLYDTGFRFHFATYFIWNLVSELWFLIGFNSSFEKIYIVHKIVIIWGGLILIHFIYYQNARKKSNEK